MSQINGKRNGAVALLEAPPDLGETLEAAVTAEAARVLPAASLVAVAARNGHRNGKKNGNGSRTTAVPSADQLPPQLLEGLRKVDIIAALAPLEDRMKTVEQEIDRLITTPVKLVADIAGHVMGAGGKRLRPALTLLSAEVCGDSAANPSEKAVTCAALVELTHTTTLLHDDVVDSATTRRGKPAANLIWGNETSVLVGDYLFAQVFVTASRHGIAELVHPLAQATAEMCAGELLETQMRLNPDMTEAQYMEVIGLKTGSLTECACRMGALAVNATDEQVEAVGDYGRGIGVAFQIVDDVFDIVATESRLGKPVGNDLREGAMTLPMLRALATSPDAGELREIIAKEEKTDEEVTRALEIIRAGDAVNYSLALAFNHAAEAKAKLDLFPAAPARTILLDVADFVLSREK